MDITDFQKAIVQVVLLWITISWSTAKGFFVDSSAYLFGEVPTDRPFFPEFIHGKS